MTPLRVALLAIVAIICSGCVASLRLDIEKPEFVHKKADPQKELTKLYDDAKMDITVAQMAELGFPVERCLNGQEPNVKCVSGIAALTETFSQHAFGNLFGSARSFKNIDSIVTDITGSIDAYLLMTIRFKTIQTKTLTMFYVIYQRQRKEITGFDSEYRYLFRNGTLIYKDRGPSAKGPIDETQRTKEWGVDPKFFFEGLRLMK